MLLHDALDYGLQLAGVYESALVAARARWDQLAGEVHDDEPLFEERATAFLEWFLLDPPAPGQPPPALIFAAAAPIPIAEALFAAANGHRSVFAVRRAAGTDVFLDDLWGGAVFRVTERRRLDGLGAGEVFEARLVADVEAPPALLFTRAFAFHPREALAAIRGQVARARAAGETRDALCFRLLRLRLRCERYRHVPPARIYADGA